MKWIVRIYSFILLGYTGWRTWDFMNSQLPVSDVSFWLSTIFLFAAEAGLLLWDELYVTHVTTSQQEQIAQWMTWVDFAASTLAGLADMMMRQTMIDYVIPQWLAEALIYGMPAIMAINVAAVFIYRQNDADTLIARKKRAVEFRVKNEALKLLDSNAPIIAKDKRSQIYADLRDEVTGNIDGLHKTRLTQEEVRQLSDNPQPGFMDRLRDLLRPKQTSVQYNQVTPTVSPAGVNGGNTSRAADDSITENGKTEQANFTQPRKKRG